MYFCDRIKKHKLCFTLVIGSIFRENNKKEVTEELMKSIWNGWEEFENKDRNYKEEHAWKGEDVVVIVNQYEMTLIRKNIIRIVN